MIAQFNLFRKRCCAVLLVSACATVMAFWVTINTDLLARSKFPDRIKLSGVNDRLVMEMDVPNVIEIVEEQEGSVNSTMILILTYFRSGSTLTGDMFNNNPAAMYFYEPLRSLQLDFRAEMPIRFMDFTSKYPRTNDEIRDVSVNTLRNIFTCRFEKLDIAALLQKHLLESFTTKKYVQCAIKFPNIENIKTCLGPWKEACTNYGVRSIKTVRMSMADAGLLMKLLPNLKVIHLIRDPRGMLLSRASLGEFDWSTVENGSKEACDEMANNLEEAENLQEIWPDRIMTILYETIAEDPIGVLKNIYKFSNLPMNPISVQWLKNSTMSGKERKCAYCTQKGNSKKIASKWRQKLNVNIVKAIDRNCKRIYDKLGYRAINNENELTNITYQSRVRLKYMGRIP